MLNGVDVRQKQNPGLTQVKNAVIYEWMSFGANGEIGIGVKVSSSIQSGFEITFHC
jgi:hypothetical protein